MTLSKRRSGQVSILISHSVTHAASDTHSFADAAPDPTPRPTPTPSPTPAPTAPAEPIPKDGLTLWLMANVGVVKDSENNVSQWTDLSGGANNATQSNVLFQPLWVDAVFNGLPVLQFGGEVNVLEIAGAPGVPGTNSFTAFVIAMPSAGVLLPAESTSGTDGETGQNYALGAAIGTGSNAGAFASIGNNGSCVIEYGPSYMPALAVYNGLIATSCPITMVYDGKTPSIYFRGELVPTGLASPKESTLGS